MILAGEPKDSMKNRPAGTSFGITEEKWTPARDLNMPAREIRRTVMTYNNNFGNNGQDTYILHSMKGYRLTRDTSEISASIEKDLLKYKKCLKRLNDRKKSLETIHNERMEF